MKEFSMEELSRFDGKEGRPVYILQGGKVYDVTGSKLWKGGLHMRRHHAGTDLSVDLKAAPHGMEVFERYPQVGILKEEKQEAPVQEDRAHSILMRLLDRYPMFRRHPHPMTVHFPIVFMMSTTAFTLLYLITGIKSLEITALHCLGAGILFIPAVMLTGLLSWWLNYMAKPIRPVKIKIAASLILFIVALVVFEWRLAVPDILDSFTAASLAYLLLILSLAPLVAVIGWFGAALTFPIEDK
jgi:predicted heme/steroid binding protein/uncharacterized membrane protein